jgi:hypothetical protein
MKGKITVRESFDKAFSLRGAMPRKVSVMEVGSRDQPAFAVVVDYTNECSILCTSVRCDRANAVAELVARELRVDCRRYDPTLGPPR